MQLDNKLLNISRKFNISNYILELMDIYNNDDYTLRLLYNLLLLINNIQLNNISSSDVTIYNSLVSEIIIRKKIITTTKKINFNVILEYLYSYKEYFSALKKYYETYNDIYLQTAKDIINLRKKNINTYIPKQEDILIENDIKKYAQSWVLNELQMLIDSKINPMYNEFVSMNYVKNLLNNYYDIEEIETKLRNYVTMSTIRIIANDIITGSTVDTTQVIKEELLKLLNSNYIDNIVNTNLDNEVKRIIESNEMDIIFFNKIQNILSESPSISEIKNTIRTNQQLLHDYITDTNNIMKLEFQSDILENKRLLNDIDSSIRTQQEHTNILENRITLLDDIDNKIHIQEEHSKILENKMAEFIESTNVKLDGLDELLDKTQTSINDLEAAREDLYDFMNDIDDELNTTQYSEEGDDYHVSHDYLSLSLNDEIEELNKIDPVKLNQITDFIKYLISDDKYVKLIDTTTTLESIDKIKTEENIRKLNEKINLSDEYIKKISDQYYEYATNIKPAIQNYTQNLDLLVDNYTSTLESQKISNNDLLSQLRIEKDSIRNLGEQLDDQLHKNKLLIDTIQSQNNVFTHNDEIFYNMSSKVDEVVSDHKLFKDNFLELIHDMENEKSERNTIYDKIKYHDNVIREYDTILNKKTNDYEFQTLKSDFQQDISSINSELQTLRNELSELKSKYNDLGAGNIEYISQFINIDKLQDIFKDQSLSDILQNILFDVKNNTESINNNIYNINKIYNSDLKKIQLNILDMQNDINKAIDLYNANISAIADMDKSKLSKEELIDILKTTINMIGDEYNYDIIRTDKLDYLIQEYNDKLKNYIQKTINKYSENLYEYNNISNIQKNISDLKNEFNILQTNTTQDIYINVNKLSNDIDKLNRKIENFGLNIENINNKTILTSENIEDFMKSTTTNLDKLNKQLLSINDTHIDLTTDFTNINNEIATITDILNNTNYVSKDMLLSEINNINNKIAQIKSDPNNINILNTYLNNLKDEVENLKKYVYDSRLPEIVDSISKISKFIDLSNISNIDSKYKISSLNNLYKYIIDNINSLKEDVSKLKINMGVSTLKGSVDNTGGNINYDQYVFDIHKTYDYLDKNPITTGYYSYPLYVYELPRSYKEIDSFNIFDIDNTDIVTPYLDTDKSLYRKFINTYYFNNKNNCSDILVSNLKLSYNKIINKNIDNYFINYYDIEVLNFVKTDSLDNIYNNISIGPYSKYIYKKELPTTYPELDIHIRCNIDYINCTLEYYTYICNKLSCIKSNMDMNINTNEYFCIKYLRNYFKLIMVYINYNTIILDHKHELGNLYIEYEKNLSLILNLSSKRKQINMKYNNLKRKYLLKLKIIKNFVKLKKSTILEFSYKLLQSNIFYDRLYILKLLYAEIKDDFYIFKFELPINIQEKDDLSDKSIIDIRSKLKLLYYKYFYYIIYKNNIKSEMIKKEIFDLTIERKKLNNAKNTFLSSKYT